MTLIAVYNSEGLVGRCDARCYNAKDSNCDCVCGGRNHRAGRQQATENTRELAESWVGPDPGARDGGGLGGDQRTGGVTAVTNRLPIPEIARRLAIGKMAVYEMLERGILPGIRLGRRWIVTRQAYEHWERTCGVKATLYTKQHVV